MYVAMETLSTGDRVSLSRYLNRALLIMLMMLFLWGTPAMDLHIDLTSEPRYFAVFGKVDTIQDQVIGHYGVTEGNVIRGVEELVHKHTTSGNEHTQCACECFRGLTAKLQRTVRP